MPEQRLRKTLGPWSLTALRRRRGDRLRHLHPHRHGRRRRNAQLSFRPARAGARSASCTAPAALSTVGRPGAGPAISLSFLLTAIACSFAALCYAELASMIPIAGSAYTYAYATLGEIFAWIIGWDLILEYAVSNMAVAVGFLRLPERHPGKRLRLPSAGHSLPIRSFVGRPSHRQLVQHLGAADPAGSHLDPGARRSRKRRAPTT